MEPAAFEDGVELFDTQTSYLGHRQIYVDERDETPSGKEDECAPVVGLCQQRRHTGVDAIVEKPVKCLRHGTAEGANAIWPELSAEYIWKNQQA